MAGRLMALDPEIVRAAVAGIEAAFGGLSPPDCGRGNWHNEAMTPCTDRR